jgi:myo-inositol-1(or 4)-monophosphatase
MYDELSKCAVEAAIEAGKILQKGFGTSFKISSKEGKNNLVTEYDKLSENYIIKHISQKFPEHVFLAEESGKTGNKSTNNVRWIIDPLDGTVNFAHSLPIFSVSIAAELNNEIVCGVIYHPILKELFTAVKGKGAFLNGELINVSNNANLDSSMLVTGFPYNVNQNPCACIDHFVNIIKRGIPIRRLGSAALDLAYVAAGRFDGFWEINLNPWDVAAGEILVREAGGRVSQYDNSEYRIYNQSILASNAKIHDDLSKILLKQ